MLRCKKLCLSTFLITSFVGSVASFEASTFAKPPKSQSSSGRIVRDDLGFSYIMPSEFKEEKAEYEGTKPSLVLQGPTTNQATTLVRTAHYTLNAYVETAITLIVFPRDRAPDFDEIAPTVGAKALLANLDAAFGTRQRGGGLNYQNSALIDVSGHPALAVLAESSIAGLNDRRMIRFVVLNHRDKRYLFFFESNDTEFESKVPAFDAFLHSLKFLQPNVAPTPPPSKPINIRIGN